MERVLLLHLMQTEITLVAERLALQSKCYNIYFAKYLKYKHIVYIKQEMETACSILENQCTQH